MNEVSLLGRLNALALALRLLVGIRMRCPDLAGVLAVAVGVGLVFERPVVLAAWPHVWVPAFAFGVRTILYLFIGIMENKAGNGRVQQRAGRADGKARKRKLRMRWTG